MRPSPGKQLPLDCEERLQVPHLYDNQSNQVYRGEELESRLFDEPAEEEDFDAQSQHEDHFAQINEIPHAESQIEGEPTGDADNQQASGEHAQEALLMTNERQNDEEEKAVEIPLHEQSLSPE